MQLYNAFIKIFLRRLPSIIAYFVIFVVIAFIMGSSGEQQAGFEAYVVGQDGLLDMPPFYPSAEGASGEGGGTADGKVY
ncbi:MAG: hypothetical protein IIZ73_09490, partial [Ruminococcus sp.]|nr:hypothetical protein [Ruminococcus sp.]